LKKKYSEYFNYTLVTILVALSGFPYIRQYEDNIVILMLLLTIPILILRKTHIEISFIIFLSVFILITYIQLTTFNVFPQKTLIGFFSKIIISYAIIKVVNKSFINIYINLLFFITICSFLFWIPAIASGSLRTFIIEFAPLQVEGFTNSSYIIYHPNLGDPSGLTRNSGPFWEPGAFAGFLIIALFFNFTKSQKITDRKSLVLIGGILSTFSTTGYITLFLFFVLVTIKYRRMISSILILIIFLPVSIIAFQKLPFLSEKLSNEIKSSNTKTAYKIHRTRFSSALIDLKDFKEFPLVGRGKYKETRFNRNVKALNRNNGTTDFLVMYGLVGLILYFTYYFFSFRKIMKFYNRKNKLTPFYFVLFILLLGFSENYFLLPFFWSICFIGYTVGSPTEPFNRMLK